MCVCVFFSFGFLRCVVEHVSEPAGVPQETAKRFLVVFFGPLKSTTQLDSRLIVKEFRQRSLIHLSQAHIWLSSLDLSLLPPASTTGPPSSSPTLKQVYSSLARGRPVLRSRTHGFIRIGQGAKILELLFLRSGHLPSELASCLHAYCVRAYMLKFQMWKALYCSKFAHWQVPLQF